MDINTPATFLEHLMGLQGEVSEAWISGDVARISKIRTLIEALDKVAGECRKAFDDNVDKRDAGLLGSDFAVGVTRMRKLRDGKAPAPKASPLDAFKA